MPDGGQLSFVADNVELSQTEAAAIPEGRPGHYVSLLVSDTGTGMSPEVRARIFEPFFTTKGEGRGTGIGLSTVLRIVKTHAGFLRVESELGQGTTFEIFLPRAPETAAPSAPINIAELPRGNGETILVVDDEQAIRDLVSEGLAAHGYHVFTAANGEEALQMLRKQGAGIRLLFTDSAMPVMDGPRLIAEARKLDLDLPVILASGESKIENGESNRGILLLSKPFSLEEILISVHRLLPRQKQ
jgi:CheY-like chemotaxis protein